MARALGRVRAAEAAAALFEVEVAEYLASRRGLTQVAFAEWCRLNGRA